MQLNTLLDSETALGRTLRLFSLYVDHPAGLRARWAAGQITKLAGKRWEVSAQTWKLDSVVSAGSIRKMIGEEAAQTDVLVVAFSALDQPEQAVIDWLELLPPAEKAAAGPGGLLVGLLGDDDHWVGARDGLVKQLALIARHRNMDFAWHWMGRDVMEEPGWLTGRVEQLLDRKQSARLFENQTGLAML